ncbi:hypothetical protein [Azospirillum canadense]|uniref:hypothetical protein n=1 Tax=Azospirillum canadense TaxID=403962 RepID=UPI002227C07D|nr:hypothetical protein [Azospirillum canadense]MCW2240697.1 hypothetical protein [Azospirillum canadense]
MTKTIKPPRPYNCRRPPPLPISTMEPFENERDYRLAFHRLADTWLKEIKPPPDRVHYPPSHRLYTGNYRKPSNNAQARDRSIKDWGVRWLYARAADANYLSLSSTLLYAIGVPQLCRDRKRDPISRLAFEVGRMVHKIIGERYLECYLDNNRTSAVACDGRVFFQDGTDELLSRLALNDIQSVYGGLNYCLAGQRCDIIDIDQREFWEVKPASLSSANLLQLWGYLDNYEMARVMAHYRSERPLPRMDAGDPAMLDQRVILPFEITIPDGTEFLITPIVKSELPGIIAYNMTLRSKQRRPRKAMARRIAEVTAADVESVLVLAIQRRRDLLYFSEQQDEEAKKLVIYCGLLILATAAAVAAVGLGVAIGAAVGAAAGSAGAAAVITGPEAAAASGQLVSLAAVRAASSASVPAIVEAASKIAASVTITYVGTRQFKVTPELAGLCVGAGCEIGEALIGELSVQK